MSRTQTFLQGPAQPELLVGISAGTADEDTDEDTESDHLRTARVPLQRSVVAHDTPCVRDEQTHHDHRHEHGSENHVKIGILGVGTIGATLTRRLSQEGHDVQVANSRGPQTIDPEVLSTGARAVEAADVVTDVDVVIVSIPLARIPDVAHLIAGTSPATVVIDTSNYYPLRDGHIDALDGGQVESLWVSEQLGRPVVKAWNAITSQSFDAHAAPAGTSGRLAIPVAAESDIDRALGMALVEETGFDAVDAGDLAGSWRQQPGAPVYCTDLTAEQIPSALAAAVASRSPRRRDLAMTVIAELTSDPTADLGDDFLVRVNRLLYR